MVKRKMDNLQELRIGICLDYENLVFEVMDVEELLFGLFMV